MMVRPASFEFNLQTAGSNVFQSQASSSQNFSALAIEEFNAMLDTLEAHDIDVKVFDDLLTPSKPDAVFPNNWVSFHADGKVILYPMMAENRRIERRTDIIDALRKDFSISEVIDLSNHEMQGHFLEGTGSVVFDHTAKIAYACRSPRTHEHLVQNLSTTLGYKPIIFDALDENKNAIYHTNVMMCVGRKFAVVCLDSILQESDQDVLLGSLASTSHQVVAISFAQMRAFAGNMIEVQTRAGDPVVLLSERAYQSLLPGQINAIGQHAELLPLKINTIEDLGGGSVRCMVAGIHLPKLK
ncbi:MAG: citrulline utilization hydrolase CtlX [Bacteroidota bacterium]